MASREGRLKGPLDTGSPDPQDPRRLSYREAPPDLPGIRRLFYSLFGGYFFALVGGLGIFVIQWGHPTSVALFCVLSVLFVGSAYGLARQTVSLWSRKGELPSLAVLETRPSVAVLYATMNDVVPECLRSIRQEYPVEVYVLDDSSNAAARITVDEISRERGFHVVRRPNRRGFKAGAINDWISQWGAKYDYIALLDSDSFLPLDWVGAALKFAEHPANDRVAVFQGLVNIWNYDTRFVQTLAPMSRVGQFVWESRLANALDAVFCYGHNVLLRAKSIREVGGFVEGYVSEDFATAVALADRGWHSRFVPLHTYEAMPENVRGFIKRQNKWTRGAMEFVELSRRSRIGASRKFHLWQTPWSHFTNLLLPVGMLLTVYGFASTPSSALAFLSQLASNPVSTVWSIALFRYLLVVGVLAAIPTVLVYRRCQIGWGTYWRHRWLSSAVSAVSLPYEAISMASYLVRGLRYIPVTPKSESPLGFPEVMAIARYSLVLDAALLLGSVLWNPMASVFNALWLVPMLLAPIVILRFSGPPRTEEGPRSVPVGSGDWPARDVFEHGVHTSLSQVRNGGLEQDPRPFVSDRTVMVN